MSDYFTQFSTENEARLVAATCQADDNEARYDVVMTPRSTYVVVVIESDVVLGFL